MKNVPLVFILVCFWTHGCAQLVVDTVPDPQIMLEEFFGASMLGIVGLETKGATDYWGTFDGTNTNIGIDHGIIMANGDIDLALGPNDILEVGIFDDTGLEGDADFDALIQLVSEDASIFDFDFVAASDTIIMHYVWASEEYPEWVANQIYNDAMAIWLDGENVALLPNGDYVCVNNVNCFGSNTDSYICNDPLNDQLVPCGDEFNCPKTIDETTHQYDGQTVVLDAILHVTPGEVYNLKFGLVDASDNGADSGVFFGVSWSQPIIGAVEDHLHGDVKVYPNPAQDRVIIDAPGFSSPHIRILDMSGRIVFDQVNAQLPLQLDARAALGSGAYIVEVNENQKTARTRLIVR